jgi:hypothetical protein
LKKSPDKTLCGFMPRKPLDDECGHGSLNRGGAESPLGACSALGKYPCPKRLTVKRAVE